MYHNRLPFPVSPDYIYEQELIKINYNNYNILLWP